jgi:transcriptional regulator with XRE-family HTH domain
MKLVKELLIADERNQSWLARKVGVSPAMVTYWMGGKCRPSVGKRLLIAKALGVEVGDLFNKGKES